MEEIQMKIDKGIYKLSEKDSDRSAIWDVFAEVKKEDGAVMDGIVFCKVCKKLILRHDNQTNTLLKHNCYNSKADGKKVKPEDKENVLNACVGWFIDSGVSYNIVEGSKFHQLVKCFVKIGAKYGENVEITDLIPAIMKNK